MWSQFNQSYVQRLKFRENSVHLIRRKKEDTIDYGDVPVNAIFSLPEETLFWLAT